MKLKAFQDEHNLCPSQLLVDYCSQVTQSDNLALVTPLRLLILFCTHHVQATRIHHDKAETTNNFEHDLSLYRNHNFT